MTERKPVYHASEHQEQSALIEWVRKTQARIPQLALLYAVPNGARVAPGTANKLKAEGLLAGVPDLCLPVARGGYHALYIEMKSAIGKASPEQVAYMELLMDEGNMTAVCNGWEIAQAVIYSYLAEVWKREE
jgi:hypothetical protein